MIFIEYRPDSTAHWVLYETRETLPSTLFAATRLVGGGPLGEYRFYDGSTESKEDVVVTFQFIGGRAETLKTDNELRDLRIAYGNERGDHVSLHVGSLHMRNPVTGDSTYNIDLNGLGPLFSMISGALGTLSGDDGGVVLPFEPKPPPSRPDLHEVPPPTDEAHMPFENMDFISEGERNSLLAAFPPSETYTNGDGLQEWFQWITEFEAGAPEGVSVSDKEYRQELLSSVTKRMRCALFTFGGLCRIWSLYLHHTSNPKPPLPDAWRTACEKVRPLITVLGQTGDPASDIIILYKHHPDRPPATLSAAEAPE